jgi:heme/copper-type cytochrome/quinol oxidase subunit 2
MKNKKAVVICTVLLVAVLAVLGVVYAQSKGTADPNQKSITIMIVYEDGSDKKVELETTEKTLRGALDEANLIDGEDSATGFYLTSVDGVTADESREQWWCVTQNGEMSMYGLNEMVLEDNAQYELTLTTGW